MLVDTCEPSGTRIREGENEEGNEGLGVGEKTQEAGAGQRDKSGKI